MVSTQTPFRISRGKKYVLGLLYLGRVLSLAVGEPMGPLLGSLTLVQSAVVRDEGQGE